MQLLSGHDNAAADHEIHDLSKRVDIGSGRNIQLPAVLQFWCHESPWSDNFCAFGCPIFVANEANSEVRQPNLVALAGKENVGRFDVSVNDSLRMGCGQSFAELSGNLKSCLDRSFVERESLVFA